MTVAVLSALQTELDLLLDSVEAPKTTSIAGWQTWTGHIADTEIVLAQAGWAKSTPRRCPLLSGNATNLDDLHRRGRRPRPQARVGDIDVANRTIQHDAGVVTPDGFQRYQAGHIPFFNPTDEFGYTPSQRTLEVVQDLLGVAPADSRLGSPTTVVFGTILTGDVFLADVRTGDRLFAEFSAHAIEMEGAALAQTSSRLGVEHIVIRSLSDLAGDSAGQHFDRFLAEASANSARLVLAILRRLEEDDRDLSVGA